MSPTKIAAKLREFEGSDELGDGDFFICRAGAEKIERLAAALGELAAIVRGECPALIDDLSGGDSRLDFEIDRALGHE